jgi:hypothetical protein
LGISTAENSIELPRIRLLPSGFVALETLMMSVQGHIGTTFEKKKKKNIPFDLLGVDFSVQ